jgi:hypothetical protein
MSPAPGEGRGLLWGGESEAGGRLPHGTLQLSINSSAAESPNFPGF